VFAVHWFIYMFSVDWFIYMFCIHLRGLNEQDG
jgi:hypothetical protein